MFRRNQGTSATVTRLSAELERSRLRVRGVRQEVIERTPLTLAPTSGRISQVFALREPASDAGDATV